MSARDTLVALGASLLAAGLLARAGRRIGLPTIPLFMIAGLLFGPNTPGVQLVDDPDDFALLATLGLILLLFYLGLAVLVAGIAEEVHVSDAIGAFMAGLVLLVLPLRDAFAALFFTFGLTVDPGDVASVAGPIAIAIAVVVNFVAAIVISRRSGLGRVPATNLATTILARGEFSLIIAALGAQAGLDARVVPFMAGYVLILALAAPVLAAQSAQVARCVPRRLVPDPR